MPTKDLIPDRAGIPAQAKRHADTAEQYRDLCSNCDNGDACAGGTRPRRPIFFCEAFVVFGAPPAPESGRAAPEQPAGTLSTNGYLGLCANCDNVRTCTSPKPAGGIWHCEEYR